MPTNLQGAACVLPMGADVPPVHSVADGAYVLGEKLGAGSFGAIYVGVPICATICLSLGSRCCDTHELLQR